jgi:hypothetical protein
MDNSSEKNVRAWVLVIGILLIFSLVGIGIVASIQQSLQQAQKAMQPVNDLSSNLGTRVSQVLNPTPTILPDPITVIEEVRSLARLETIQYSVEKVITAESGQGPFGFLFGDRLLLVAHGVVVAGIDLNKLDPQDVRVQQGVLYVRLPASEIFTTTLDNNKSYVFSRDTGLLSKGDITLETSARQAAEMDISDTAIEDGILDQAQQNGENYLYRLFRSLGFKDVIFVNGTPTSSPNATYTSTP